ncbi:NAD(P)-dependent dehydrogenase (short-subunit alcohol dehydrogenase family) [Diaminobutyricimonas aerilata]|uniref:NAD(P)-dependent dehydrogenase (Short-subunit alcohol dehydrogenase family) n=1 Tax=Diaminobutyricimonas aerilata TaxID=1162967 RepID=A0A2M9CFU9_9MICO|nr:SDR family oxidoreductase [Diaminobutyricimonas aerilata]PJJ70730.1 NAD(P)-dependent dehydrogenase (short-subunit alcohol dehydrogenase family) [Diaminobutyricimonas aerilata]
MTVNSTTHIVLLGATSGIGLATARAAALAGARVTIGSRRASSVTRALAELPDGVRGSAVDASSTENLARFFDAAGEFDHFAYTAAEPLVGAPLADYTVDAATAFLGLRLVHALDAVRLAVPHVKRGGSVTLTSGTAAFKGGVGWTLGAAASGAMISVVRSLAVELAPIRVNAVAPGVVRSPLWDGMGEAEREDMYRSTGESVPLGRVAEVGDVAKAYLALMDQDYVTGAVSVVDGGTLVA